MRIFLRNPHLRSNVELLAPRKATQKFRLARHSGSLSARSEQGCSRLVRAYFDTSVLIAAVVGSHPIQVKPSRALKPLMRNNFRHCEHSGFFGDVCRTYKLAAKTCNLSGRSLGADYRNVLSHF